MGLGGVQDRRSSIEARRNSKQIGRLSKQFNGDPSNGKPMDPSNNMQELYVAACLCNNTIFDGAEPAVDWTSRGTIAKAKKFLLLLLI